MRMFIAVDVPWQEREKIAEAASEIIICPAVRAAHAMHVTLLFLGEQDEARIPALTDAMQEACSKVGVFEIGCRGISAFPSRNQPRVIISPVVQGVEQLRLLHYLLERTIQGGDSKRFSPHITVGRVKHRHAVLPKLLKQPQFENHPSGSWTVGAVRLYQSVLAPDGAQYSLLSETALQEQTL